MEEMVHDVGIEYVLTQLLEAIARQNEVLVRLNDNLERLGEAIPNLSNSPIAKLLGVRAK